MYYKLKAIIGLLRLYLYNLLDHIIKTTITISILFVFISCFTFNLQIQQFNTKGILTGSQSIVQVDTFIDNVQAYIFEQ